MQRIGGMAYGEFSIEFVLRRDLVWGNMDRETYEVRPGVSVLLSSFELGFFVAGVLRERGRHYVKAFRQLYPPYMRRSDRRKKMGSFNKVRPENFLKKGLRYISAEEIRIAHCVLREAGAELSEDRIRVLQADAWQTALRSGHGKVAFEPRKFSRAIGLDVGAESHAALKRFVGDYFIFRRTSRQTLVAYHMRVTQDDQSLPARFVTRGRVVRDGNEVLANVEGVLYQTTRRGDYFFAIGGYLEADGSWSNEIRSTILEPVGDTLDLFGIRLGLNRSDRRPSAYRVWCARQAKAIPESERTAYAREYLLKGSDLKRIRNFSLSENARCRDPDIFFRERVPNLTKILTWLGDQPSLELSGSVLTVERKLQRRR